MHCDKHPMIPAPSFPQVSGTLIPAENHAVKKRFSLRDVIVRGSACTEHPSAVPLQSLIWDTSCSRVFGRSLDHLLRAGSCPETPCPSLALNCGPDRALWHSLEPGLSSEAKESVAQEVSAACRHRG